MKLAKNSTTCFKDSWRSGYDDGTSGVEFSTVEEHVRDILSFQNGKAERSEKWRTAFTKGQLEIQPGEEIPHYDSEPWDKQRDHFPALDKPEKAAVSNVYHFLPGRQPPPALHTPRAAAGTRTGCNLREGART